MFETEREREREGRSTSRRGRTEGEEEGDFPLSREPSAEHNPMTLRS